MIDELLNSVTLIVHQTQYNLQWIGYILLIPWVIFFITRIFPQLLLLGIIPRRIVGLPGILFAPLLHANFNHLFFNSIPLVVLSNFILINGLHYFIIVTIYITVIGGSLLWLFGKSGLHIGASGLITGYWALLISTVYRTGTFTSYILAALIAYYFAGIFFGIFPREKGGSWQGHLFGLIAGIIVGIFARLSVPTV